MTHYDPLLDATLTETPVAEVETNKREKLYMAGEQTPEQIEALSKLPKQARQIYAFLVEIKEAKRGSHIIEMMIEQGKIETRQNPAVLFAFYARTLEGVGMIRI